MRYFNTLSAIWVPTALFFALVVNADTSLWIPETDPEPISAGIVGVGNDGRTTWALQQGSATGTFTDQDNGPPLGTVTLVEGPSDAFLTFAMTTQGETDALAMSCTVNNGVAVCVATDSGGGTVETDTETETVSPYLVQGGGPISGASGSGPTSTAASGGQTQSAGGNQPSAGSTPSSSGPNPTGTGKNSAGRYHVAGGVLGVTVAAGSVLACVL